MEVKNIATKLQEAYSKILESSSNLLDAIKRESATMFRKRQTSMVN